MQCYFIKSKIEKYLDHELAESERHEIMTHLQNCTDCTEELESLRKIEEIAKSDLYVEPPKEYWKTVPKIINSRLGLRAQPAYSERLARLARGFVPAKRLRWGLASTFAVVGLIILVRLIHIPDLLESPVNDAQNVVNKTIADNLVAESSKLQVEVKTGLKDNKQETLSPNRSPEELEIRITEPVSTPAASLTLFEESEIKSLNPRKPRQMTHAYDEQLIPISNANLVLDTSLALEDSDESENIAFPIQRTFARGDIPGSQKLAIQNRPGETEEAENTFTETLWIVQQSKSLSEKRNIWLSYINREEDPTYRSLGIYNLALVLSEIAEKSKQPESAKEAMDFYKEHEKSLRVQMGARRYEIKTNLFQTIINR